MAVMQLGYLGFEVRDLDAWAHFAEQVLGLGVSRIDGGLLLRMDGAAYRFFVHEGPLDDLALIGWLVADASAALAVVERLEAAGTSTERATAAEATQRQVEGLVRFTAPGGYASELAWGLAAGTDLFESEWVSSCFLAGDLGLGHCVLTVPDRQAAAAFYTDTLGLKLSDTIETTYFGLELALQFFHTPSCAGVARHHSLALTEPIEGVPAQKRCNHFMLEVGAFEDVGRAFDRTVAAGLPIMQTIGRHPNDQMLSFYAMTPSGFQFEFGCEGRLVDDANWEPEIYDRLSDWGHHPPVSLVPRRGKR
jgi:biphenyl-2,3-diol 1,2-dioxygenase/3,4-dihydroxy-9,10-secoandrosta-1,3,5(10)-triene-9,17-dione 4,5-dioxygenase